MLVADEADARCALAARPHACGDTTFGPAARRWRDEHGLSLVFQGPCPRCGETREERFTVRAARPRPPASPAPAAAARPTFVARGGSEERDLYGATATVCVACDGVGSYRGVTGDYGIGDVTCGSCGGTGHVHGP